MLFPLYNLGYPHESMPKAQEAAEKAIQINNSLAAPYAVMAYKNFTYDWNPNEAKRYFEKALQINPKYAPTHYWYGQFLVSYGLDSLMVIKEMRKAVRRGVEVAAEEGIIRGGEAEPQPFRREASTGAKQSKL